MENTNSYIESIFYSIITYNPIEINKLPIALLDRKSINHLVRVLIKQCFVSKNEDAVKSIIEQVNILRSDVDTYNIIFTLFDCDVDDDVIKFVIQIYGDCMFFFTELINMHDDELATQYANKLSKYINNRINWQLLYHLTDDTEDEEYRNPKLKQFIYEKMINEYTPEWVKDFPKPKSIPIIDSEYIEKINSTIKKYNDPIFTNIKNHFSLLTVKEKTQFYNKINNSDIVDDTIHFREFGPVNCISVDPESDHICSLYGGCRMLTCSEFELYDEDGTELDLLDEYTCTEWFRGCCDICPEKIRKKHYAVRLPLEGGGWSGCYCSFNCLKKISPNDHYIERMKNQLDKIGIRDRD